MIENLKPYPEYRDSGSRWLGAVPSQWDVLPLGGLLAERKEKNDPIKTRNILSLSLQTGVIPYADKKPGGNKAKEDLSAYMLAYPGDIVLNSMNVVVGSVGLSKYFGAVSPVYYVLRPRRGDDLVEFFDKVFQDHAFQRSLFGLGNGILVIESKSSGKLNTIRMRIPMTRLRRVQLPYPNPKEQVGIVRFLDYANGQIERAITATKKLIKLLNEEKHAIILRAVTRGLDQTVLLKASGIPWLGDIPQHWEVSQLRRLVKYGTSITYGIVQAGPHIDGGIPYIRTSDMKKATLPQTGYLRTTPEIDSSYRRSKVEPGDLVVAIRATLGKGLLVPDQLAGANLTQGTARVSPGERLSSQFLFYAFNSKYCQDSIQMVAKGTTFLEITLDALRRIPLAVPPLKEQDQICVTLARQIRPLAHMLTRTEHELKLLQEYRTRLITDVVTGKLDVREAARQLPIKVDELSASLEAEDQPDQGELESNAGDD
jgi:type I restriction enzyme, S subunit